MRSVTGQFKTSQSWAVQNQPLIVCIDSMISYLDKHDRGAVALFWDEELSIDVPKGLREPVGAAVGNSG